MIKDLISVVISTYNRCESLKDTLDSLLIQEHHDYNFEVIIVDNNSKDNTKEVVDSYKSKFGNGGLRYIFEQRQGLSPARNHGIREAKGKIVAFTDDDAMADKEWLKNLYDIFINNNADCVGGKILLDWKQPRPNWLDEGSLDKLGSLDYGNNLFKINSLKYPIFGGNFAIQKTKIIEYGLFREDLGRKGDKLYGNEEIDLFQKMISNKENIFYQPKAIIFHKVPAEKLKKRYFRKWHYQNAELDFILNPLIYKRKGKKYFLGIPTWMILKLFTIGFRYMKKKLVIHMPPAKLFTEEACLFYYLGLIATAYKTRNKT